MLCKFLNELGGGVNYLSNKIRFSLDLKSTKFFFYKICELFLVLFYKVCKENMFTIEIENGRNFFSAGKKDGGGKALRFICLDDWLDNVEKTDSNSNYSLKGRNK